MIDHLSAVSRQRCYLSLTSATASNCPIADSYPCVGIAFIRVRLSVCLSVRALTGKRLELSTPNLLHVHSIAVARHALTQRSKGQRSRSQYVTKTVTVARLLVTPPPNTPLYYLRLLPAWVCMSIRLPMFSS